jgi:hypothetical protein
MPTCKRIEKKSSIKDLRIVFLMTFLLISAFLLFHKTETRYPHSLKEGTYEYYVSDTFIKDGNDFSFVILEGGKDRRTVRLINEKDDSLKIKVNPLQEGTVLVVNKWDEKTNTFLPIYFYAKSVEIIVKTEEMKREWEKIIKEAVEKEENLLKPRDVTPRLK